MLATSTTNQLGCECWQSIILAIRPAVFDLDVLALNMAAFAEALTECRDGIAGLAGLATAEEADHGHCWRLLRVRGQRPLKK